MGVLFVPKYEDAGSSPRFTHGLMHDVWLACICNTRIRTLPRNQTEAI